MQNIIIHPQFSPKIQMGLEILAICNTLKSQEISVLIRLLNTALRFQNSIDNFNRQQWNAWTTEQRKMKSFPEIKTVHHHLPNGEGKTKQKLTYIHIWVWIRDLIPPYKNSFRASSIGCKQETMAELRLARRNNLGLQFGGWHYLINFNFS